MKTSDATEFVRAVVDAQFVAHLLDRLTPEGSGSSTHELSLLRAHAWALVEGLRSLAARSQIAWADKLAPVVALEQKAASDGLDAPAPLEPGVVNRETKERALTQG
jgi:hypothetical protein